MIKGLPIPAWHLPVLWLAIALGSAIAQESQETASAGEGTGGEPLLAVLPFANYTGSSEAVTRMMPLLYGELAASEVAFISDAELRPVLRRARIRASGKIGRGDADRISLETGVTHLLLGSLDIYRPEGNPEAGLSVRLVKITDMTIIKAASVAATGEDYTGLFGIGRVSRIEDLTYRLVQSLFEDLDQPLLSTEVHHFPGGSCARIALVPFDNLSAHHHGGDILMQYLLTELVGKGFVVLEPGIANQLFLKEQVAPRGQIDLISLAALHRQVASCYVVTGAVERFRPAQGGIQASVPELSFGLRLLDAADGRLLMTFDEEKSGTDSETLFQSGREHCLGKLTMKTMKEVVEKITKLTARHQTEVN